MSGDLVSLRMLVVGLAASERELWRKAATVGSIPVDFDYVDANAAIPVLASGETDICLLDSGLAEDVRAAVTKAARAAQPSTLVVISAPTGSNRIEGVDGMLTKPTTVDDARHLTEICIRAKIPTKVLVVDDSGTMRSIVRKILSASRYSLEVHEAAEGIAALNELRDGTYGLVFLDYNMPGLNGFETLSEIKRENPSVAVVMMTSTIDNAIADRAHAAGALAFLKKPFYPADIDMMLQRYYGLYTVRN